MPYPRIMREVDCVPHDPRSKPSMNFPDFTAYPDARGHFGRFGGRFVTVTLEGEVIEPQGVLRGGSLEGGASQSFGRQRTSGARRHTRRTMPCAWKPIQRPGWPASGQPASDRSCSPAS